MCVTVVTCECVCVALVAIAGRRYTYTVCTLQPTMATAPPRGGIEPNTAFARITTRLWLLPNSVDRKIKYFACTACAVQRCPDCEYPTRFPFQLLYPFEGHSERYHPSENSVVDDRLFHLWKEKIGRPRVDITDTG